MNSDKVFYELILPYRRKDTIENAKIVIENIKTKDQYITVLTRSIGYSSIVILEEVIKSKKFEEFKKDIQNDTEKLSGTELETTKERLINNSLKTDNKKIFMLIYNLFEMKEVLPKYQSLSDIVYYPGYYDGDFINTKTNIYYLTDLSRRSGFPVSHFEDTVTSMRCVLDAGREIIAETETETETETENYDFLTKRMQKLRGHPMDPGEEKTLKEFCVEYYLFYTGLFKEIIEEIIEETEPSNRQSKSYCWGILSEYLNRDPTDFEIDALYFT